MRDLKYLRPHLCPLEPQIESPPEQCPEPQIEPPEPEPQCPEPQIEPASLLFDAEPSSQINLLDLYTQNPYESFKNSNRLRSTDLQGWGGEDPIFGRIIGDLNPELIIEIGTWKGMSAINMAKKVKSTAKIICVDTWLGALEFWTDKNDRDRYLSLALESGYPTVFYQFLSNVINEKCEDKIIPFPQTSIIAAQWFKFREIKFDLIYIDASHEFDDVYGDIKSYWTLLKRDCVMFGHDSSHDGVSRALHAFREQTPEFNFKTEGDFWIANK